MKWMDELKRLLRRSDGMPEPVGLPPGGVSCEEAAERVFEWLDGELDPGLEESVGAHLETCARCNPRLVFEQSFRQALTRVKQDEAAPDALRDEIMKSLRTEGFRASRE